MTTGRINQVTILLIRPGRAPSPRGGCRAPRRGRGRPRGPARVVCDWKGGPLRRPRERRLLAHGRAHVAAGGGSHPFSPPEFPRAASAAEGLHPREGASLTVASGPKEEAARPGPRRGWRRLARRTYPRKRGCRTVAIGQSSTDPTVARPPRGGGPRLRPSPHPPAGPQWPGPGGLEGSERPALRRGRPHRGACAVAPAGG